MNTPKKTECVIYINSTNKNIYCDKNYCINKKKLTKGNIIIVCWVD